MTSARSPRVPPGEDAAAYAALERLRWGGAPERCPHCGVEGRCTYLPPRDGARRTRTGAVSGRRVWRCAACRRQFSVLTATVLSGSRVPATVLLAVLQQWRAVGRPRAAEVAARHRVTPEAARLLLRRIGAAVGEPEADPVAAVLGADAATAAAIRRRTPARLRPRRQVGPSADYGTG